ncbi:hypothetical protein SKAU_G00422850 [Synaphobranchus kaupii]|uniref:Uncharacterized protein n=1 Tax=Synaphobranchus kaupii TaxID=118154 RepID=A0A9Q1E5A8_SYNKA|nr:hypothetical protein SKAU_G00422850 [Synaphobranchus kaupii]
MAFLMKHMLGDKLKNMTGGGGEEEAKTDADGKETPQSKGMSREEFEEYQRQLVEEKPAGEQLSFRQSFTHTCYRRPTATRQSDQEMFMRQWGPGEGGIAGASRSLERIFAERYPGQQLLCMLGSQRRGLRSEQGTRTSSR